MQQSFGPRAISVRLGRTYRGPGHWPLSYQRIVFHQYIEVGGPAVGLRDEHLQSNTGDRPPGPTGRWTHTESLPSRPATVWLIIGLVSIGLGDFVALNQATMSHLEHSLVTSSVPVGDVLPGHGGVAEGRSAKRVTREG